MKIILLLLICVVCSGQTTVHYDTINPAFDIQISLSVSKSKKLVCGKISIPINDSGGVRQRPMPD